MFKRSTTPEEQEQRMGRDSILNVHDFLVCGPKSDESQSYYDGYVLLAGVGGGILMNGFGLMFGS